METFHSFPPTAEDRINAPPHLSDSTVISSNTLSTLIQGRSSQSVILHSPFAVKHFLIFSLVLDVSVSPGQALLSMKLPAEQPPCSLCWKNTTRSPKTAQAAHRPSRPTPPSSLPVQVESDLSWKSIFPWSFCAWCFWLSGAAWAEEMCCIMRRTGAEQLNKVVRPPGSSKPPQTAALDVDWNVSPQRLEVSLSSAPSVWTRSWEVELQRGKKKWNNNCSKIFMC